MKQSITFLKQLCVLLLFVGLTACGGAEKEGLRSEIEQTLAEISDELTALKAVTMEQQGVLDGLKEDLKWEYSEELDKLVSQYGSEFSMLKENIGEMNGIYDVVAGYQDKLGGAPLEYSMSLIKELLEENRERFENLQGKTRLFRRNFTILPISLTSWELKRPRKFPLRLKRILFLKQPMYLKRRCFLKHRSLPSKCHEKY
ncbi:hypothetical protein OO006_05935 [Prosthecochloris sp. SCSIO W1101]|uniref:hypothetical protein n=1 Tax=Prosthecochloris sp. SCSIO W1101 TaxID=2992242 RepID=UPI00223E7F43|nr:hypothetical protein [Prosthecochloris sp. SCSIO W1101]UZJ42485.1 hypothetical protein OO006_05935 [Prosthecochloris sp. SCSIO W1101]